MVPLSKKYRQICFEVTALLLVLPYCTYSGTYLDTRYFVLYLSIVNKEFATSALR